MVNDPISDFLTRVRNATLVSKSNVEIPHSNFKFELAKLFKDEGYISDVESYYSVFDIFFGINERNYEIL